MKIFVFRAIVVFLNFIGTLNIALAAEINVSQKGKVFNPTEIEVAKGDVIIFKNDDTVAHNVFTAEKGQPFNLKIQKPGEEGKLVVTASTDFKVRCAIHPKMQLKIKIKK